MAPRRLSSRQIRYTAARTLVNIVPGLRARMPMYDLVRPMIDVGRAETICETQEIRLDAEEAAFALRLPNQPPRQIER